METNKLVKAIRNLRPNAEFTFKDEDYSTIEWITLEGEAPTKEEIDVAIEEFKAEEQASKVLVETKKQEVLDKLGLTIDEVTALLA